MSQIRFSDKVVDFSCATENRQQSTDAAGAVPEREAKANPSPESSEEDRDSTVTACTGNDAIRNRAHDAGKHFRRARHSQSGCCQDCQRTWSVECLRHEIQDIIPLASERNQSGATKINKVGTMLNNSCQFKIQAHRLNRTRRSQDITVVYDVTSKESINYILAEGNRHTEHEQHHGSSHQKENLKVKSFQRNSVDEEAYHRADHRSFMRKHSRPRSDRPVPFLSLAL